MNYLFDPEWVQRIIAFLFPNPIPGECSTLPGIGCLPTTALDR